LDPRSEFIVSKAPPGWGGMHPHVSSVHYAWAMHPWSLARHYNSHASGYSPSPKHVQWLLESPTWAIPNTKQGTLREVVRLALFSLEQTI
jgi:hypothetical protein